ncbi:MAG: rod shape-determining protein MreC [Nocardioides marinisabuli]|uniref:rod shape-determining protein MreC n=1 Tax=Nocardioides marinisabuli TaxID=419476 RepID=UPI00321BAD13
MALLDRVSTPRRAPGTPRGDQPGRPRRTRSLMARHERRERRWGAGPGGPGAEAPRPSRSLLVALLLATASVTTLDVAAGDSSPLDPVRGVLADTLGPAQSATTAVVRPFTAVGGWFESNGSLREEVATLEAENSALRSELNTSAYDRNRLAEYDGLTSVASDLGYSLVPSRVVGVGPAQSFSSTVTIDAGTDAGVQPDMTVVNNDGLVGRVLSAGRSTATVLLLVDPESTVGARVGDSMEMGFLSGRGVIGDEGRLDLELVDDSSVPARADSVVTWGSEGGAPYLAGIPVGRVTKVYSSLRETAQRAVIDPYVDFGALDLVGVVVPTGTRSDRGIIGADGEIEGGGR